MLYREYFSDYVTPACVRIESELIIRNNVLSKFHCITCSAIYQNAL